MRCSRCNDDLPADAPPSVRTCRDYADMIAREHGDMLDEESSQSLMLMRLFCSLDYALANGEEELTNV